jgi:[phosphatase 2A protein]-leucine-carboxy methyltransferase
MASIPNLNTLRTGRGGPRLRGGRRGGGGTSSLEDDGSTEQDNASKDRIIQQTDYDASSSRLSALELDYLTDPYAKAFLKPGEQIPRRYPIINRGTYVRSTAIDTLVLRFLQAEPGTRKQIISLGAGSDTRLLRLVGDHAGKVGVVYHELDFETNILLACR